MQTQSVWIGAEVRHALLGSSGCLLGFAQAERPRKPNKRLLLERAVDPSKALDYLRRGCERNPRVGMDRNLENLLTLMLPVIGQVISAMMGSGFLTEDADQVVRGGV